VSPYTGAVGYPTFEYRRVMQGSPFKQDEILVRTSPGGFTFDKLVYWPEHRYPDAMYGGEVERVRTWAYVHE
jgi:hypothetical protein